MPTDICKIIGGPALVKFAGATFYSKGNIVLETSLDTFDIVVDRFRKVDERQQDVPLRVRFTPCGEWEDLGVLFPYPNTLLGDLITPSRRIQDLAVVDSTFVMGLSLVNGARVFAASSVTLPTGWNAAQHYFVGKQAAPNTYALYDTRANAIAGTPAGKALFTDVGVGNICLIQQEPLVIHTFDGMKITFHNAAVVDMPNILASAVNTLLGEVTFECFIKNDTAWDNISARYSIDAEPLIDTSFDPDAIITQAYVLDWGAAPWAGLSTKNGVAISFDLNLEPIVTDTDGTITRRLAGVAASAVAQPIGPNEPELMNALRLQGQDSGRGKTLTKENLVITGDGVHIQLYGAALKGGPQNFSSSEDRIGNLTWVATRTFNAGVPNPLFYVGAIAP